MLLRSIRKKFFFATISMAIALNLAASQTPINAGEFRQLKGQKTPSSTNNGLPSYRRDGGTRGHCVINSSEFVALVPDTAVNRTASLHPKLYFYVPKTEKSQTIEFVLRDSNDNLIYEKIIETKDKSGIMSVEIPLNGNQETKSLDSETHYHWYLSNICHPEKRSQDIVLEGWIEHKTLSASTLEKLKQLSPDRQAKFYQQQALWYDAIAIAAAEIQANPQQSEQTQWSKLLTDIGLPQFARQFPSD